MQAHPENPPMSSRQTAVQKLLHASAPAAALLLGSLFLTGCDTAANQEDQKVQADVATAVSTIDAGNAIGASDQQQQQAVTATKALETASADAATTPMTRAYAKNALALAEQNTASKTMRQIDLDDASLHQLIFEIGQLAQQVDASRAIAAGYAKYDPKPAQDAIAADIAAAQGGPDKPLWIEQDGSSMPSLSAVTQTISQLQTQLAKQADDLKSLQDQRTQVLDEADQADKSSEISKGQASVDDFTRASNLRKQAGDLTVQIEKNQAQTIPLQKDLAVAQGQQVVLQELLKQFQDQSDALDAGWKSVQDAVASQAVLQKQIVAGSGDSTPAPAATPAAANPGQASATPIDQSAGPSLNEKADALSKLVQTIASERSDALSNLNNAIHHYGDAANAAAEYTAALDLKINEPANAQRPEQNAWKNLKDTINPQVYHMNAALAQRQLAELYVAQVDDDNRRAALQDEVSKLLTAANIPIPTALSDTAIDADKTSAGKSATDAYTEAGTLIDNLTNGGPPVPLKDLARVQKILTLYGQVQLARAMGDSTTAQQQLAAASQAVSDAVQSSLPLPPLPPELAAAAVAPATPATPTP
jgi:hypothetical protein